MLNNLRFKYPTHENYTLQNISLTISPSKKIALVGEHGSMDELIKQNGKFAEFYVMQSYFYLNKV